MDLSKAKRMDLTVTNPTPVAVKVSLGFASALDWKIRETTQASIPSGKTPTTVSFRLDGSDFKSAESQWKYTQKMPNSGRIDKMLVIVEGLPAKGTLQFDQMRFGVGTPPK